MQIKINNKTYDAKEGEMILDAAKRNGIKIPTLCSIEDCHEGLCRVCVVECGGKLITSCNTEVREGMEIITESENIDKARRINLELLWSDHAGKCASCDNNRICEFQKLAEELKIENFHFVPRKGEMTDDEELDLVKDNWSRVVVEKENPCIVRNSEYCIECRRCINVCPEQKFGMNYRAGDAVVGTPGNEILDCSFCGKCLEMCPTGALVDKNDYAKIVSDLDDLKKFSVAVMDLNITNKIKVQLAKISKESDIEKILKDLGFEKIIYLKKEEENREDEIFEKIKTEEAKAEKMAPENIVVFFLSSKIYKKAQKNKFLDYILSEREVARLVRDKGKKES